MDGITDWAAELAPYYDQAARMLGVTANPTMTPTDEIMKAVADEMGVGRTFSMTPVGVYFGEGPGVTRDDPFFGGVGPERTGCIECGECMTGCRYPVPSPPAEELPRAGRGRGGDGLPAHDGDGPGGAAGRGLHHRHGSHGPVVAPDSARS